MQFILVGRVRRYLDKNSFREAKHGGSRVNHDEKMRDFAEVWVAANRSRALNLMRYVSTLGAAFLKRWEAHRESAADRATPIQVPARSDMAIAESAVRSGGK
jgi:hypothetical protein